MLTVRESGNRQIVTARQDDRRTKAARPISSVPTANNFNESGTSGKKTELTATDAVDADGSSSAKPTGTVRAAAGPRR
jgi:hypothetical protein